eukprot:597457-Pyramimonas_sp.AAC.1
MPTTRSKAMVFADARMLANPSSISSTRTATLIVCRPVRATQRKHLQRPTTWWTAIPRSSLCANPAQGR